MVLLWNVEFKHLGVHQGNGVVKLWNHNTRGAKVLERTVEVPNLLLATSPLARVLRNLALGGREWCIAHPLFVRFGGPLDSYQCYVGPPILAAFPHNVSPLEVDCP